MSLVRFGILVGLAGSLLGCGIIDTIRNTETADINFGVLAPPKVELFKTFQIYGEYDAACGQSDSFTAVPVPSRNVIQVRMQRTTQRNTACPALVYRQRATTSLALTVAGTYHIEYLSPRGSEMPDVTIEVLPAGVTAPTWSPPALDSGNEMLPSSSPSPEQSPSS